MSMARFSLPPFLSHHLAEPKDLSQICFTSVHRKEQPLTRFLIDITLTRLLLPLHSDDEVTKHWEKAEKQEPEMNNLNTFFGRQIVKLE